MADSNPTPTLKRCFKCLRDLPLTEFYRHAQMLDGHLSKCRDCTRRDVAIHRAANVDKVREYDRERAKLPHRVALKSETTKRWRDADPRRGRAHNKAARMYRNKPELCEGCSKPIEHLERHHPDYDKPDVILWLCKPCHAIADKIRRVTEESF